MTIKSPPNFEVYFGDQKIEHVKSFNYNVRKEGQPIYELGSRNPSSFSTNSHKIITGHISCYLDKDIVAYHYSTASLDVPELHLNVRDGLKVQKFTFDGVSILATSHFPSTPKEGETHNSMLYDMNFVSRDLTVKEEYDFTNASNEEIEEYALRPLDDDFVELPLTLELRR